MFLAVSGVGRRDADARYSGVLRKIVDRLLGAFSHFFLIELNTALSIGMTSAAHAHWTARRNDAHRAVSSSSFARRPSAEKELNVSTAPPFFFVTLFLCIFHSN
jgi:hypothetical protein